MLDWTSITRKWLGLLCICLLPVACLVESEDDPILRINLESVEVGNGYLVLFLMDTADNPICDLWAGNMPSNRLIQVRARDYDGSEAILVVQEYANPDGLDTLPPKAPLLKEVRIRVKQGGQALILPTQVLETPGNPVPADQAYDVDTILNLTWSQGVLPSPGPQVNLYMGTANPPPLFSDRADTEKGIGPLRPDQVYYWRIECRRAGQSVMGPVWSFRTRPAPPTGLALKTDSLYRLDDTLHLRPVMSAGTRIRFALSPGLPEGLRFDSLQGSVEGILRAPDTAGTEYTLEAANVSGKERLNFTLRVRPRAIRLGESWPDSADRIRITLVPGDSGFRPRVVREGPPPFDRPEYLEIAEWDGGPAELHISGWMGERHVWEARLALLGGGATARLSTLPGPELAWPLGEAVLAGPTADFRWHLPKLDPPVQATFFLGRKGGPDTLEIGTTDTSLAGIPVLPDAEYIWGLRTRRGQEQGLSERRTFRTLPLPPYHLSYGMADTAITVGAPVSFAPEYRGGNRTGYTVSPPLPDGLAIDAATGVIAGRPTGTDSAREHTVRVDNAAGWLETRFRLRVDRRLLSVTIPAALQSAERVVVWIRNSDESVIEVFWDGPPPPAGAVERSPQAYAGGPAVLHIQAYAAGTLTGERRFALDQGAGKLDSLAPGPLAAPFQPFPADGAVDVDTSIVFAWKRAETLPPQPLTRLHLGASPSLEPIQDSLAGMESRPVALRPDQAYSWRVDLGRGQQAIQGPVWTFRTRPSPPASLAYTADSLVHVGRPISWQAQYRGGGRVRYRVQPALPAGLTLDTLSGRIEGVPAGPAPLGEYTITVANASGSREARLAFAVGPRLIDFRLPDTALQSDRIQAFLVGEGGSFLDTLWDGPRPDDMRIRRSTSHYDGVAGELLMLGFRNGLLVQEHRYALNGAVAAAFALPLPDFPSAHGPMPSDGSLVDTVLTLAWAHGMALPPVPLSRIYLGLSEPLPLLTDSLAADTASPPTLVADTVYSWRVESLRAGRRVLGPTWSFRTRPHPPAAPVYPAECRFNADSRGECVPTYPGSRAVFRISPPLPAGLLIDSLTGRIAGAARILADRGEYEVTASNASGAASARFHLEVGPRLIDFTFPEFEYPPDSTRVLLVDASGGLIADLWNEAGPPDRRKHTRPAPGYDGKESVLLLQAFWWDALRSERRYRVVASEGIYDSLPPLQPPVPILVSPDSGALMETELVEMVWSHNGPTDPHVRYQVFASTDTLDYIQYLDNNLKQEILQYSWLPTDTTMLWGVEAQRAGIKAFSGWRPLRTRTTAPTYLEYSDPIMRIRLGMPVHNTPSFYSPCRGLRFRVEPSLPSGLSLDSLTGLISGTPILESARTEFTVYLSNSAGSTEAKVFLEVLPPPGDANLVARWDMDGNPADSSGNGHHGAVGGTVAWQNGVQGQALSLAGDGYVRVEATGGLLLNAFTISLWYKQAEGNGAGAPLLEYSEPAWMVGLQLSLNTQGWGTFDTGYAYLNLRPSDALPGDQMPGHVRERNLLFGIPRANPSSGWYHLAVVFDPGIWQARMYINGIPISWRNLEPDFLPLTRDRIFIGFRPGDNLDNATDIGFRGLIDQIEIYDGPLDDDAIFERYERMKP